jgi:hypothetical protein
MPIKIQHLFEEVENKPSCICGNRYFKINGIDAINKITKLTII